MKVKRLKLYSLAKIITREVLIQEEIQYSDVYRLKFFENIKKSQKFIRNKIIATKIFGAIIFGVLPIIPLLTYLQIVHYLDIPIQHINNKILRAMRRPDSRETLQRLIDKLRSNMPDIVLRTTLIVGFPGETDRQFDELLEFVRRAEFDALGCFKFYPESGTEAAKMAGQVPDEVKQQRLEKLMLTQQEIVFAKNKRRIGGELTCLVDSADSGGNGCGRFYGQAPEIDSVCIIRNCPEKAGKFTKTRAIGTKDYDLVVEQI